MIKFKFPVKFKMTMFIPHLVEAGRSLLKFLLPKIKNKILISHNHFYQMKFVYLASKEIKSKNNLLLKEE